MFLTGRFSAKLKNTVAHLRHFEKRSFERKIEAIHPVQSVIPLKFTGRSRPSSKAIHETRTEERRHE